MNQVVLVARREIRERLRARSFRVATVLTTIIVIAAIAIPASQRGHQATYDVGVVGATEGLDRAIVELAAPLNVQLRVHDIGSIDDAQRELTSGILDVVVNGSDAILTKRPVEQDGGKKAQLVAALAGAVRLQRLSPADAAALAAPVRVSSVQPSDTNSRQRVTAFFGVLLLFMFFQQYGAWVLVGVVEEKSSRVVEILLAAMRPRQLVTGKVAGIGTVALLQAAIVGAAALIASSVTGYHIFEGASRFLLVWVFVWFFLGYGLYAMAYAAVGSLVSRQADAQNAAFPLAIPILVGYITATSLLGGDVSTFARVLAFLPPTAPLIMPMLIGIGRVPGWQIAISVAEMVVAIAIVIRVAGDVYARAILHSGRRLRLREVLNRDFSAA